MDDINLTNIGTVDECGSKKYIEWKIHDYFSLSQKENYTFKSPPFSFLNQTWNLIIYPFGHIATNSVEYVGIFATKPCFTPLKYHITCKIGIKTSELFKYVSFSDDKVSEGKYLWGTSKLLLQSVLLKDKNRVAPHGVLTVFCTLRVKSNIKKESKINWKETENSEFVFGSIPKQLFPLCATENLFSSSLKCSTPETKPNNISTSINWKEINSKLVRGSIPKQLAPFWAAKNFSSSFKFSTPETKPNSISTSSVPICSSDTPRALITSTIKFNPPTGIDTIMTGDVATTVNTKLQNITVMREYTFTSVEELRAEHYASSQKKTSENTSQQASSQKKTSENTSQQASSQKNPSENTSLQAGFLFPAPQSVSRKGFDFNPTLKKPVFSLPKTTETNSTKPDCFISEGFRIRARRRLPPSNSKFPVPLAKPSNTSIPSEAEVADTKEMGVKTPGQEDNNGKDILKEENTGSTTKQTSSFGATAFGFNFSGPVIKPSSFSAAKENAGSTTEQAPCFGAKNAPSFSFNFDMPFTMISSTSAPSKDSIIDTREKDSAKKDGDEKYVLSGKATVLERREEDSEMVDESDVLAGEAADTEEKESTTEQRVQNEKDILGGLNELSQDFKNLLLSGEDSDTVMKVGNQEFKVHKTVLQARSSVFASMFRNNFKEKTEQAVNITDCDPDAFQRFLLYLYSGKVEKISSDHVLDLYRTADKYDVKLLKAWCIDFFISNLSVDNFCDVMTLALEYEESALIENATQFFSKHIREIIITVKWLSFHKEHPIESNELHIKALNFLHSG